MATFGKKNNCDIECGVKNDQLYPGMQENPQLRWGFIRKVYAILCMQLLLTFGVALTMFLVHPVREFMKTPAGSCLLIGSMVLTTVLLIGMYFVSHRHPWDYVALALFTITMAFMIGAACTQRKGKAVLLAAGLTLLVTFGLTLYTFVAAKRGRDFSFLGPFLFCAALLLIAFGIIRLFFPFGRIGELVFGLIGALIFSGFIVYDTDELIKRFNYDQYIDAAASLYLDIINLFLYLLLILDD